MAKRNPKLLNFVAWLTGILVSLAVGFGMIGGTLSVPYIGIVNIIAGWIVIVTSLLSVLLTLIRS